MDFDPRRVRPRASEEAGKGGPGDEDSGATSAPAPRLHGQEIERLAAMGTMLAVFAHEVRNPLAALRSLAESLREDLTRSTIELPQVPQMLDVIDRVDRLVRTALQFGRPAPPQKVHRPPAALLGVALSELAPRTRGENIRVDLDAELPDAHVDDAHLVQVLVILLDNALDAVGSPGRVLVRTTRGSLPRAQGVAAGGEGPPDRSAIRFEVTDDGPGIRPDLVGRIFEPFFTTKSSGVGLGLSIAQQLVHDNGGTIDVTSEEGRTTFVVTIPARAPHAR